MYHIRYLVYARLSADYPFVRVNESDDLETADSLAMKLRREGYQTSIAAASVFA